MGMDISGLNPQITGIEPKWPKNYDELSQKAKDTFWELRDEFHSNNPGVYFRANIWSWRPIHLVCMALNDMYELEFDMESWAFNDGGGLKTQEECTKLANALEKWIKIYDAKGIKQVGFNLGSWTVESIDGNGYTLDNGLETDDYKELNDMYPHIVEDIPIKFKGRTLYPSHHTQLDHIKEFITFLNSCGGFEIW